MSFSKGGKSTSSTSSSVSTVSRNLNIQDTEGLAIGEAGGDVTIIQTDMNAFDDASELARRSLDVSESLARESFAVIQRSTEEAFDFGGSAFEVSSDALKEVAQAGRESQEFAGSALREVSQISGDALSQVRAGFEAAGDFVANLFGRSLDFVRGTTERQQESLGETVSALNVIAREQSKSTDERVAEVAAGAQKNIVIIVGVIAAGALGYAIFSRR